MHRRHACQALVSAASTLDALSKEVLWRGVVAAGLAQLLQSSWATLGE
jgi:hypothetical protein